MRQSVEDWERLVIIVSYSLWDIVSYSLEYLLGDIVNDPLQRSQDAKDTRYRETAQRFYPLLKMKEGYTVFRPLIKYNNDEILNILSRKKIPFLSIPCKFKNFRPKRILEKYYEKMGLRFNYDQLFNFARASLNLPHISAYTSISKEDYLLRIF